MEENKDKACLHSPGIYQPRCPEKTILYQVFQKYLETYLAQIRENDEYISSHIEKDFRQYLTCGILSHGFARVRCECGKEYLMAYSCKGRGVCPSCNTRRMAETAAHLVDHLFSKVPMPMGVICA